MGKAKGCAIGCGVVLVIILIAVFVGVKMLASHFGPVIGNITGTGGEVAEILKEVGGADAFTPPENGLMDENRFAAFIAVRQKTLKRVEAFAAYVEELENNKDPKISEIMKIFDELGSIFVERARGLREYNMSLGEYNWYFKQIAAILIAAEANELPEKMKGIIDAGAIENAIARFSDQLDNVQKQGANSGVKVDSFEDSWNKLQDELSRDRKKLEAFLQKYSRGAERNYPGG